jgi:uncharacterized lipoprotein YbaY
VPVKFSLDLDGVTIDPATTYTIQATIIDGENAWATGRGVPVLTKGNPSSNVAITLDYRPDLIKGAVTGQITGTDVQVGANGYSMAVLLDPATGDSLGNDVRSITAGLPVPFSIGFTVTDIAPTDSYVVTAEVGDGSSTWRNAGGVPVITNGNPKAGVQVPVTAVRVASPSPAPTASPSPSPTVAPAPPPGIGTSGNLLLWIILVALVGAAAAFLVARNRDQAAAAETTETTVPSDGEVPPAGGEDATAGAAPGETDPVLTGEPADAATQSVATGDTAPADTAPADPTAAEPTAAEPAPPETPPENAPEAPPATDGPTPS